MIKHLHWPWLNVAEGWSAVDCQGGLFGVSVRRREGLQHKIQVLQHAALPGEPVTSDNLGRFKPKIETAGFDWVSILGRSDYQMLVVDKTTVSENEMEKSLRWSISPLIDYPPDKANISWIDIPVPGEHSNRTPQVYVIASRRDCIHANLSLFEHAHIDLSAIDIRETAQRNISAALETVIPGSASGLCLVHAEPGGVQVTVTHNGELYMERYIRESVLDNQTDTDGAADTHQLDRIALEIQRSINLVQRNYSFLSVDRIFVTPMQKDIGLADHLGSRLGAKVENVDLGLIFDWPKGSDLVRPEIQALHFNALGAALRCSENAA